LRCGAVADSLAHLGKAALLGGVCCNALAQLVSTPVLAGQVFVNSFLMIEVIRQAGVNVSQTQRRETQHNFFSGRALLIVMHDRFESNPRVGDPNRAIFSDGQRHVLR